MRILLAVSVAFFLSMSAHAAEVRCPLKTDPPPAIDGDLAEWYANPRPFTVGGDQVTYNKAKWKGEDDLSGTLWFYWDENYLYVAAAVVDDKVIQDKSGNGIWYGDHLELYVDPKWTPDAKGVFGRDQMQIGLSPGNFGKTGDPIFDLPPEAVIAWPEEVSPDTIKIAAKRTENGYNLEAAIPWKLLKVAAPKKGMTLGVDFAISDTDTPGSQDKMSSLVPGPWDGRHREHLVPLILSDSQGK